MAAADTTTNGISPTHDTPSSKRKRLGHELESLANGNGTNAIDEALESFHNLLEDLIEVLQEFDVATKVLNVQIQSAAIVDRAAKRAKLNSSIKTTTISSVIRDGSYTTIDTFWTDIQKATAAVRDQPESAEFAASIDKLEEEVLSILSTEIENNAVSIPRSEDGGILSLNPRKDETSLATDANLVLTIPGFMYSSLQGPKRLYSSFRTSSNKQQSSLPALPLDRLPNNVTATTTKISNNDTVSREVQTLKDILQGSKRIRVPPPSVKSTSTKNSTLTWTHEEKQKRSTGRKDKSDPYDQELTTGQWLSYNNPPSAAEMPTAQARRRKRDRALSTGDVDAELTRQEREALQESQEVYQYAKVDSLFKSIYSSFAPSHDNTGAIIPKSVRSRHWWIKYGAARYLASSTSHEPFPEEETLDAMDTDKVEADDKQINDMLESWIDPELVNEGPRVEHGTDKEAEEILSEISEMLFTLSSYQRNRLVSMNRSKQGSSEQNKILLELVGDRSTPTGGEQMLYETLRDALANLIATLPPHAVAKLNGQQMGELNISTKLLVEQASSNGTLTFPDQQASQLSQNLPVSTATKLPPAAPSRTSSTQQVSTPTPAGNAARPASIYSRYGPPSTPTTYQNHASRQQQTAGRSSYGQASATPMINGTRPTPNGYSSYSSQASPQRPPSSSTARPGVSQTYSYNNAAVAANTARSASPANTQQAQRSNWNPSDGTIGSMFSAEEVSRLEERQKAQMIAQAGQIRGQSSTPLPGSQALSPASNGTPGR